MALDLEKFRQTRIYKTEATVEAIQADLEEIRQLDRNHRRWSNFWILIGGALNGLVALIPMIGVSTQWSSPSGVDMSPLFTVGLVGFNAATICLLIGFTFGRPFILWMVPWTGTLIALSIVAIATLGWIGYAFTLIPIGSITACLLAGWHAQRKCDWIRYEYLSWFFPIYQSNTNPDFRIKAKLDLRERHAKHITQRNTRRGWQVERHRVAWQHLSGRILDTWWFSVKVVSKSWRHRYRCFRWRAKPSRTSTILLFKLNAPVEYQASPKVISQYLDKKLSWPSWAHSHSARTDGKTLWVTIVTYPFATADATSNDPSLGDFINTCLQAFSHSSK